MSIARVIKKFLLEIIRETMISSHASNFHQLIDFFFSSTYQVQNNNCLLNGQQLFIRCTRTDLIYNL